MHTLKTLLLVCFLSLLPGCFAACGSTIESGHMGILVDNMAGGDSKNAFTTVRGPDMVWVGPFHTLYNFDTTAQSYAFTDSQHEGRNTPEAFQFQTVDGSIIHVPIQVQFHVPYENVVMVFNTYRKPLDQIRDLYIRNTIRESLNEASSGVTVQDAIGIKKNEIMTATTKRTRTELAKSGIALDSLNLMGAFIPPQSFTDSINSKNVATQKALEINNEIAQSQATALKNVAEAEGQAKASIARAKGEGEARRIQAEAEATANRLVAASITPTLVEYRRVDKWDGAMPSIQTGTGTSLIVDHRTK